MNRFRLGSENSVRTFGTFRGTFCARFCRSLFFGTDGNNSGTTRSRIRAVRRNAADGRRRRRVGIRAINKQYGPKRLKSAPSKALVNGEYGTRANGPAPPIVSARERAERTRGIYGRRLTDEETAHRDTHRDSGGRKPRVGRTRAWWWV